MSSFYMFRVVEQCGFDRQGEPVSIGVPCPRGLFDDGTSLLLTADNGESLPFQSRPLMRWSDGSVKWLLVDFLATVTAGAQRQYALSAGGTSCTSMHTATCPSRESGVVEVQAGPAAFRFQPGTGPALFAATGGSSLACELRCSGQQGEQLSLSLDTVIVEETGPIRTRVLLRGGFTQAKRQLALECRFDFFPGQGLCRAELALHNPSAALHPGGIWDLGDSGSIRFTDLSLVITGLDPSGVVELQPEPDLRSAVVNGTNWVLYQDSSGGEQWDSPNHVGADGRLTVSFPGYRLHGGDGERLLREGKRALPRVHCPAGKLTVSAGVEQFWQNFPKAIRRTGPELHLSLFPRESLAGFELQGGERKRHVVWFQFAAGSSPTAVPGLLRPLQASLDPEWVAQTGAVTAFIPESKDGNGAYLDYVRAVIEGENSFVAKREAIDEYGWRNFGDLYADHEAAFHKGGGLYPSHYNNQYDFIYGAFCHFLRSGDQRWRELMADLARHVADIDIYHTDDDRAAYNHGQFWHSYHYQSAGTGTHRGFTRVNIPAGLEPFYGGGPSNEQNYASGLLHYHLLTGDPWAREAVLELAGWSIAMDDGAKTLLGILDSGPTGLASQTGSTDYHHPGRGPANCINTLLDAYALTRQRRYLDKAEELIRRCIHPKDDISALQLDEPEIRWFYLVFLQILGKYLDVKTEMGESDYTYYFARDSLLHYARWVHENEVPYKEVLHKVEYPTETWSAQDIRKACVLNLAASHASTAETRHAWRDKARFFYQRCLDDLRSFPTAFLTRPLVLLAVYGTQQGYFEFHPDEAVPSLPHTHDYGVPAAFRNQRQRVRDTFSSKLKVTIREGKRMLIGKLLEKLPFLRSYYTS